jgi:hypothetical protein
VGETIKNHSCSLTNTNNEFLLLLMHHFPHREHIATMTPAGMPIFTSGVVAILASLGASGSDLERLQSSLSATLVTLTHLFLSGHIVTDSLLNENDKIPVSSKQRKKDML